MALIDTPLTDNNGVVTVAVLGIVAGLCVASVRLTAAKLVPLAIIV